MRERLLPLLAALLLLPGWQTAAAQSGTRTYTVNGVSFKMVEVDGGTFQMGATPEIAKPGSNQKPVHTVHLRSYAIGETEVTCELWYAVMGEYPQPVFDTYRHQPEWPVYNVTWQESYQFCRRLSELTGETFRLPTEAEWEFAARGGNLSRGTQFSGSDKLTDVGWRSPQNHHWPMPVAQKLPNELGLYDMSGNAQEYCADGEYDYPDGEETNPHYPSTGLHVLRGGSYGNPSEESCTVSARRFWEYDHRDQWSGFRLAAPAPERSYDLWVDGRQVTNQNCADVLGDGTVRYSRTKSTMRLHNAIVSTDEADADGIRCELDTLVVILDGANAVRAGQGAAISYHSNLNLTGRGTLDLAGQDAIAPNNRTRGTIAIDGGAQVRADATRYGIRGSATVGRNATYYTTLFLRGAETQLRVRGGQGDLYRLRDFALRDGIAVSEPAGASFDKDSHELLAADGRMLAGAWAAFEAPPAATGNAYDLNQDGAVDVSDVTTLVAYVLAPDGAQATAYDLNQDGAVDVSDVTTLVAYVLNPSEVAQPQPATRRDGTKTAYTVGGVTFRMVAVQGGTFQMGATKEQQNPWNEELPAHEVTLSDYAIGETEVTQELWQAVMGRNPSQFNGQADLPVEKVSWEDCQDFLTKLNALTGEKFRLPTEAEWEFAARGGNLSRGAQYSGSPNVADVAWYSDNAGSATHPVGTKMGNELGLYDMSGNVAEWCSDWWGDYFAVAQTDPTGAAMGTRRVYRSSSWADEARSARTSARNHFTPTASLNRIGLRLAK